MAADRLHVVWFKRDLRVLDHAPLVSACAAGKVLPLFIWAPQVWAAQDASKAQALFVRECLHALSGALQALGLQLHVYHHDPRQIFQRLHEKYGIAAIYSHQETGNDLTYQIDLQILSWCRQQAIPWQEWPQNGVVRKLQDRQHWSARWTARMQHAPLGLPSHATGMRLPHHGLERLPVVSGTDQPGRQHGGIDQAHGYLADFLQHRVESYPRGISSPQTAPHTCSRLSPYLSWGAISLRTVMQATQAGSRERDSAGLHRNLHQFESRLHWHCHFMQKLESEPRIEFESFYTGFDRMQQALADVHRPARLHAWQAGETGWPLVDACMAMLRQTGWLNFRMRAMLMSTASYLLCLPWRESGLHLARYFVDYEPGIHWPQVQMQSGTTGINILRIYHPVRQALAQDPRGVFVRRWLPALRRIPDAWIFEPWQMPAALQSRYGCIIGRDYPSPLVDISQAAQSARQHWHQVRQEMQGNGAVTQILQRHASRKSRHFPRQLRGLIPDGPIPYDQTSPRSAQLPLQF